MTQAACPATSNLTAPEAPDEPSPRSLWSVRGRPHMLRSWCRLHKKLVREAATYDHWSVPSHSGSRLVLLGDSITESWRGTEFGARPPRTAGVPRVLREGLGARWPSPLVLGIAGDQTQHVLWRLEHGEASAAMAVDPHMLCALLIGTNNLGFGQRPAEAAAGVLAVVSWLLRHTAGRVLVMASLPRGDGAWRLRALCPTSCRDGCMAPGLSSSVARPPACREFVKGKLRWRCVCDAARRPRRSFMPAIARLNELVRARVEALRARDGASAAWRLGYVDCGAPFVGPTTSSGTTTVRRALMPDALHPNASGHALLGSCIAEALERLEAGTKPQ